MTAFPCLNFRYGSEAVRRNNDSMQSIAIVEMSD
jgi:hypothetical protein